MGPFPAEGRVCGARKRDFLTFSQAAPRRAGWRGCSKARRASPHLETHLQHPLWLTSSSHSRQIDGTRSPARFWGAALTDLGTGRWLLGCRAPRGDAQEGSEKFLCFLLCFFFFLPNNFNFGNVKQLLSVFAYLSLFFFLFTLFGRKMKPKLG